jgi:hypothetical protein
MLVSERLNEPTAFKQTAKRWRQTRAIYAPLWLFEDGKARVGVVMRSRLKGK